MYLSHMHYAVKGKTPELNERDKKKQTQMGDKQEVKNDQRMRN